MNKIFALLTSVTFVAVAQAANSLVQSKEILSPIYTIDRKYKSMEGPQSTAQVYLTDSPQPELVWITGFRTQMVGADGKTGSRPEFMCHVNLDYDAGAHRNFFGGT